MGFPIDEIAFTAFTRVFDAIGERHNLSASFTVRDLIERLAKARGVDSRAEIEVSRVPSTHEIRAAALRDLTQALEQIGIQTSGETVFTAPAESVFPQENRLSKWIE